MLATGLHVLKNFLNFETPSNKVIEVKADTFISRRVHLREDGLLLYLPESASSKSNKNNYEIVLKTESLYCYSLFRTPNLDDAEVRFITLQDKLQTFVGICKDMYNVEGIQKICDILTQHPTWNLAHLAVHFSQFDLFNHPKIYQFLNTTDKENGMSPLQVAITTKNLKTVQILIASGCSCEHIDNNSDSVFHYAATTTKEIVSALAQGAPSKYLSIRNKNGYTPLHIACQTNNPECVKALILAGADVNKMATNQEDDSITPGYIGDFLQTHPRSFEKDDMKMGGTPLHWSCSRQVINDLVEMNCHIDALNFNHQTALHIMVIKNRLECVVALLSRGANADLEDADGNRPIHLAVKGGQVDILKALIVFGADINIINSAGQTARHLITKDQETKLLYYLHAVGAKRCTEDVGNCTEGCKYDGTFDGEPPPRVMGPTNRDGLNQMLDVACMEILSQKYKDGNLPKNGRLLCLDGGGIRGLVLIQILLEIEKILKKPLTDCFDWIAGTSTGGILALGIASGKSMNDCLKLYFRMKDVTFVGYRPYSSEPLENILKETFGSESVMADLKHPRVMVTGVLADRKPAELHLFRNYESPSNLLKIQHDSPYEIPPLPEEQFIWQVGRATGAAPTYFRSFDRYLDGGLIANNPTLDALTEVNEHCLALRASGREAEARPVSVVVSLGTGVVPVTPVKEIDVFLPGFKIFDSVKVVYGIQALGTLLVDQATASDGRVVDRARSWCSSIGVPYFRFSPQMSIEVNMDETSDDILCTMLWETKVYMHQNLSIIKQLADLLN